MKFFTMGILMFIPFFVWGQEVLFQETVENGILQNTWNAGYRGNLLVADTIEGNPSGDTYVGRLGNDLSGGNVGQSWAGNVEWSDYFYEAQIYINFEQGTYYGIEFRVDSTGNTSGYQLLARANEQKLRFRARPASGFPTGIQDWVGDEIPGGFPTESGWHKMGAKVVGNQIWLYFDAQELPGSPFNDTTHGKGAVGLYTWDFLDSTLALYADDLMVTSEVTNIEASEPEIAREYNLEQNYPNPFNPTTTINFVLEKTSEVNLTVYDITGKPVRALISGMLTPGEKKVNWDATDEAGNKVTTGIYFYTLQTTNWSETKKMILIK